MKIKVEMIVDLPIYGGWERGYQSIFAAEGEGLLLPYITPNGQVVQHQKQRASIDKVLRVEGVQE
jgi:hypothetical protein